MTRLNKAENIKVMKKTDKFQKMNRREEEWGKGRK